MSTKVDVKAIIAKANQQTVKATASATKVSAITDDYRVIPGFTNYEINSKNVVRNRKTKMAQAMKKGTNKFQLFNDSKERKLITLAGIKELLPATESKKPEEINKLKTEKKAPKAKVMLEKVDVSKHPLKAQIEKILEEEKESAKHKIQYRLHLAGVDLNTILSVTASPYNATKRNIWYYTSGQKSL